MDDKQLIKSLKRSLMGCGRKVGYLEEEIADLKAQLIEAQQQLAVEQKSKEHFWRKLKCPKFYKGWLNR